jgi:type IV pilus assembly protein PilB
MDIAESRIPQDGRIKLRLSGRDIDFRVSTMPTIFGEKVVLRLLDKGNLNLNLSTLGFERQQLEAFKRGIMSPNGMVLVTGPTGSGKTTTLYSSLLELNKVSDNISTVEDPVEYNLPGINQVQVNKDIGLTFASVLRTMLRQDPDIILIGEIRDFETAEVAIQSALTGHLVLSTVHTNDAPSTVTRLVNMGVEPFLITASVNTIVAQRLLRRICPTCRAPAPAITKDKLVQLGLSDTQAATARVYTAAGCPQCNGTGYKGRFAIYEVMEFSTDIKEAFLRGGNAIELRRMAIKNGMKSLRIAAMERVAVGDTSIEEAVSMTLA